MYHLSKSPNAGETELNLLNQDLLPMSRYDMTHGDEIHIETISYQPITTAQQIAQPFLVKNFNGSYYPDFYVSYQTAEGFRSAPLQREEENDDETDNPLPHPTTHL